MIKPWLVAAAVVTGGAVLAQTPVSEPGFRLTDVTAASQVAFWHFNGAFGRKYLPETLGSGVAVFDADGDGQQDVLFVNGSSWPGAASDPGPRRRGSIATSAARRSRM